MKYSAGGRLFPEAKDKYEIQKTNIKDKRQIQNEKRE